MHLWWEEEMNWGRIYLSALWFGCCFFFPPFTDLTMKDYSKALPNNEDVWHKGMKTAQIVNTFCFSAQYNLFFADADVIHYIVDKFRNVVYTDLALYLIGFKSNALQ